MDWEMATLEPGLFLVIDTVLSPLLILSHGQADDRAVFAGVLSFQYKLSLWT